MTVLLSVDGTVLGHGGGAEVGSVLRAAVGRPVWDGPWPACNPGDREQLERGVRSAAHGECVRDRLAAGGAGGRAHSIDITLTPLYDGDGCVRFILAEGADVEKPATGLPGGWAEREQHEPRGPAGQVQPRRGGIAHEINNGLAGIKNAFLLIKDVVPAESEYFEYLDLIDREIERIARIVAEMSQCPDR